MMKKIPKKIKTDQAQVPYYLGIDPGEKKVGLALADSETKIAFSFGTLPNNRYFFSRLDEIFQGFKIYKVIVGSSDFGTGYAKKDNGNDVARYVEKKYQIPVLRSEEFFSTKIAAQNLRQRGMKKISKNDDSESARVILESWLEKEASRETTNQSKK